MRFGRFWTATALVLTVGFGAFFSGCNNAANPVTSDITTNGRDSTDLGYAITGFVYDANGTVDKGLANVIVRASNDSGAVVDTTDANGFYHIFRLSIGRHKLTFQMPGYAGVMYEQVASIADSILHYPQAVDPNVPLYKLDATLTGKIYVVLGDSSGRVVANGAEVQAWPSNPNTAMIKQVYKTTADALGNFSFDSLPRCAVTIVIPEYKVNGVAYAYAGNVADLRKISSLGAQDMLIRPDYMVKMMSTNITQGYFEKDTLVVSFSDAIDPGATKVVLGSANIVSTWSADGLTLTVIPVQKLARNSTSYTLSVVGKAISKKILNWSMSFRTTLGPVIVSAPTIMDASGIAKNNVSRTDTISVTVSEALTYVSLIDSGFYSVSLANAGKTIKIVPIIPITTTMLTSLTAVDGIRALTLAGNQAVRFTLPAFTLMPIYPVIKSSNVLDASLVGKNNIPTNTTVTVTLSKAIMSVTPIAGFDATLSIDKMTISYKPLTTLTAGLAAITAANAINGVTTEGISFRVTLPAFVLASVPYVVSTNLRDLNGNQVNNFGQTDTISVTFSEAIDTTSFAQAAAVTATLTGSTANTKIVWTNSNTTLKIIPIQSLPANTAITLNLTNAVSAKGQPITNPALAFRTIGSFAFANTNFLKPNGTIGEDFPLTGSVVLNFTSAVDTLLVKKYANGTMDFVTWVKNAGAVSVPFSAAWSNGNKTLTLTAHLALQNRQIRYDIAIAAGLPSIYAGLTLGTAFAGSFTTVMGINVPRLVSDLAIDTLTGSFANPSVWKLKYQNADLDTLLPIRWADLDSVDGYIVYARGTKRQTNWVALHTVASNFMQGSRVTSSVTRLEFDLFNKTGAGGDALVDSNKIQIAVAAYVNGAIDDLYGPLSIDTIKLADVVSLADSMITGYAGGAVTKDIVAGNKVDISSLNTAITVNGLPWSDNAPAASFTGDVVFPEPMNPAFVPTLSVNQTSAAGAVVVSGYWVNRTTYRFVITQPAGLVCSNNILTLAIQNCYDASGNRARINGYSNDVLPSGWTLP